MLFILILFSFAWNESISSNGLLFMIQLEQSLQAIQQTFDKQVQSNRQSVYQDPRPTVQRYYNHVTTQAETGKAAQEIIAQLDKEEAGILQECTKCSKSSMLNYALDLKQTHNPDKNEAVKKLKEFGIKAYPDEQLTKQTIQQSLPPTATANALQIKHVLEGVYNIEPNSIEVYATPQGICMAYFPNIIQIPYSTLMLPFGEFTACFCRERATS